MAHRLSEDVLYYTFNLVQSNAVADASSFARREPSFLDILGTSQMDNTPPPMSPSSALLRLSLVCKTWHSPAMSVLYHTPDPPQHDHWQRTEQLRGTLTERKDLAARVLGLRITIGPHPKMETLRAVLAMCGNLERMEYSGLTNVTLRDCLDALIEPERSLHLHTLSLSTLACTLTPTQSRLTCAYLSHRLSYFPLLRHLTLVDFVSKPCVWTTPTYSLHSLSLQNCLLGESFVPVLGNSSRTLTHLHITERETPSIHDLSSLLLLQGDPTSSEVAASGSPAWAESLAHVSLSVRSGLPLVTLAGILSFPQLRILEYEGSITGAMEEMTRGSPKNVERVLMGIRRLASTGSVVGWVFSRDNSGEMVAEAKKSWSSLI